MRRLCAFVLVAAATVALPAQDLQLPNKPGSFKFAVIGDTGTGDSHQLAVSQQLARWREQVSLRRGDHGGRQLVRR